MVILRIVFCAGIVSAFMSVPANADGNAARGRRLFSQACAACHSLEPDRNMTGPSLADLWQRKAGGLASFSRYSPALKSAGIVWDDRTLEAWLENPQRLIPGNTMPFPGVKDKQRRDDLLAFLKQATQPGHAAAQSAPGGGQMGGIGMGGMGMGGGRVPHLKTLEPQQRVQAITYCKDTYRVTTADGQTHAFWERNLRLKTDSGEDGPEKNRPALVGAGMMGDRADVIFADPKEISAAIVPKC
jgi:cytochrome c